MYQQLTHFGVKGMKWGVRKQKDEINSKSRTIKKGTEIQNITNREFTVGSRHMYAAYTPYDKTMYKDLMGNFMYNGRAYANTFVVKKDIKVPSDKDLVEAFVKIAKENPKQVAKDMSAAYNAVHLFSERNAKVYSKKLKDIDTENLAKAEKLAKEYISNMVDNKAKKSRDLFFGELIKNGFDAMSDVNDREGTSQDPLIIFNPPNVLGDVKSVKLTSKELDYYWKHASSKEFKSGKNDLSSVQR